MDFFKSLLSTSKDQQTISRPRPVTSESQTPLLPIDRTNAATATSSQAEEESPEEGTEYTTASEILGWLLYALATEPFVVSAMGTYVPLLLEQYARDNGVRLDDHSLKCVTGDPLIPGQPILPPPPPSINGTTTEVITESLMLLFARSVNHNKEKERQVRCVLYVMGYYIDTSSFALYTFSLSVLVQTLTVISMSGAADRGHYRKHLLLVFGLLGALATTSFGWLDDKRYYLASLLAVFAISCFGAVNVCGNSYLPILTSNSKEIRSLQELEGEQSEEDQKATALLKSNLTTRLSGLGAAVGYASALVVQLITIFIVIKTGTTTSSIQIAISFVGIWWFVFLLPLFWLLKSRLTAPSLPNLNPDQSIVFQYVKYGWRTLFISIKHASTLKDVLIYLLGWFIISDSVTTMNSTAILFAKTELLMTTPQLVLISMLTVISAIIGSVAIPKLQAAYSVSPKLSMIYVILWASVIPLYGILGFFFENIGLKSQIEMFFLAVWYGISMGGLATVSRSLFSLLIPKGKESTFFSLFAVTDKGSSIVGPMVVGLITDKMHDIRYCFWFLLALMWLSLPVWYLLDVERGAVEARELEFVEEE
ncbi:hypothetical protein WICPIJ_007950 [Wickerhamomyces pijperi]|uniref:Autophagy-related protein n=1 Tax=Wickerhamomyces pijperi TaxID=599730 RepID=A0A9P8Q0U6_WICPI|nr:hypothetical protein WICPIJ_007950 [Wickerhamomyces pijperi]